MNDNVIEIISLLIQKILNEGDIMIEEEVIEELLDLGYNIQDIDEAFELIYNGTDIIEAENLHVSDLKEKFFYNRIFTISEKLYLPVEIQGLLLKLMSSNLLSFKECEEVIIRAIQTSLGGSTTPFHLWSILEEVVDRDEVLEQLSVSINEFKDMITDDFKYIN